MVWGGGGGGREGGGVEFGRLDVSLDFLVLFVGTAFARLDGCIPEVQDEQERVRLSLLRDRPRPSPLDFDDGQRLGESVWSGDDS